MLIKSCSKSLVKAVCLSAACFALAAICGLTAPSLAQPPAPALNTNQDGLVGIGAFLLFERYTGSAQANPAGAMRPILGTIIASGPAAVAELKTGDVVLAIDGRNTAAMKESAMVAAIRGAVGTTVKLKIERRITGGEPDRAVEHKIFEVTLTRERVSLVPKASLGVTFQMVFLVQAMPPDSPAARAGLKKGDVLLTINKRRIVMDTDVRQAMLPVAPGQKVEVEFMRYHPEKDAFQIQRVMVETAPVTAKTQRVE